MNIEFLKTSSGKKFIENDIPQLIIAIKDLAKALEKSNKIEEKKLILEKKRTISE